MGCLKRYTYISVSINSPRLYQAIPTLYRQVKEI